MPNHDDREKRHIAQERPEANQPSEVTRVPCELSSLQLLLGFNYWGERRRSAGSRKGQGDGGRVSRDRDLRKKED